MYILKSKWIIANYNKILNNSAILVKDGKIEKILNIDELKNYKDISVTDYGDSIIMPSFTNAHIHQYGILSWGIPKTDNFSDFEGFLKKFWWPLIEDRLSKREILLTSKLSTLDLLSTGVTAFCDTVEAPLTEMNTLYTQGKVVEEIGLKAILSLESSERVDEENGIRCLGQNSNFVNDSREFNNVKGCICTHTTFTCSDKFIQRAKAMADSQDTFLQFHLSESIYEKNYTMKNFGLTPIEYLDNLGILDENTLLSQCVKVDSKEIETLAKRKCKVVHNPISNCEVGGGFAPVQEMLDKGIDVSLGTDGYVNDFFEVMRFAFLIHKANHENTEVMNASTVFKMATENGAKILGFNQGIIEEGYDADFIILNDDFLTPVNENNIFDLLVVKGERKMIEDVYIQGKKYNRGEVELEKENLKYDMKNLASDFWGGIK